MLTQIKCLNLNLWLGRCNSEGPSVHEVEEVALHQLIVQWGFRLRHLKSTQLLLTV